MSRQLNRRRNHPLGGGRSAAMARAAARSVELLESRCLLSAVTTFPVPGASADSFSWDGGSAHVVTGPDGNLWFTDTGNNQVDRVTPQGQITTFPLPVHDVANTGGNGGGIGSGSGGTSVPIATPLPVIDPILTPDNPAPADIVVGPDGNLWFTESGVNRIGRITTAGTITEFTTPTADSNPLGIAAGADGNLWFTETGSNAIGRITPAGTVTEFSVNSLDVSSSSGIAAGPGGDVWFVAADSDGNGKIARITPAGKVSNYDLGSDPVDLTEGPDGNLWVATYDGEIDKVTAAGTVTRYTIPSGDGAYAISAGPDGALWFALDGTNQLGRITTTGTVSEFSLPDPSATDGPTITPGALTSGPDHKLWFVDAYTPQVGNVNVTTGLLASGVSATVDAGSTSTATVASFVDFAGGGAAADYTATVAWDDGTTSAGTIAANSSGGFDVSVSRNWALSDGSATVTVTDTRTAGRTASASTYVTVNPPPVTGAGVSVTSTAAALFSGVVGSFSGVPLNSISSYSASIDWGDGHTSQGTLASNASGGVDVSGSNRYAASGSYTVTVSLSPYPGGFLYPIGGGWGIHPIPLGAPVFAKGAAAPIAAARPVSTPRSTGTGIAGATASKGSATTRLTTAPGRTGVISPIPIPIDPPIVLEPGYGTATSTMTVAPGAMDGVGFSVQATTTAPFTGEVASFKLTDPNADLSHLHATVVWSDPQVWDWFTVSNPPSDGSIMSDGQGGFTVSVSTTFANPGWSHFSVNISDDRLGTGDSALVGVAYGQLIVDSPFRWLPILESQGANSAAAKTPSGNATSTAASTAAANVNPALNEQITTTPLPLHVGPGGGVTGNVGILTGLTAAAPKLADLHGTIHWGDGSSSPATFAAGTKGRVFVRGAHQFTQPGSFPVSVDVQQTLYNKGKPTSLYPLHLPTLQVSAVVVQRRPVTSGGVAISAVAGQPFSGTLATFTAPDPGVAVNRVATVFWGDGTHSTGTVAASGSDLTITGTHTYARAGKRRVLVLVTQSPAQRPLPRGTVVPPVLARIITTADVTS